MALRRAVGRALGPALIALFLPPVLWYHEDFCVHMCGHPTQRLSFVYTVTNTPQGLGIPTCGMIFPKEDGLWEENLEVALGYSDREFQGPCRLLEHELTGWVSISPCLSSSASPGGGPSWKRARAGPSKGWGSRAGTPFASMQTQEELPNKLAAAASPSATTVHGPPT